MSDELHQGNLGKAGKGLYLQGDPLKFPEQCLPCVREYEEHLGVQKKCIPCIMFDEYYIPPRRKETKPWQAAVCPDCGQSFAKRQVGQKWCDPCRERRLDSEVLRKPCSICGKVFVANSGNHTRCQQCRRTRDMIKRRYTNTVEYRRSRDFLLEKMGHACARCGREITDSSQYELHHIVPICDGGPDEADNLTILCLRCHKVVHRSHHRPCQDGHLRTLASALS